MTEPVISGKAYDADSSERWNQSQFSSRKIMLAIFKTISVTKTKVFAVKSRNCWSDFAVAESLYPGDFLPPHLGPMIPTRMVLLQIHR
jgi:hypothetical protein